MADRTIKSPLPGTFYRRSAPDADPYVADGGTVRPGDVVGLIELMKTFHEVKAEESGTVQKFLVASEEMVEAGQDLAVLGD